MKLSKFTITFLVAFLFIGTSATLSAEQEPTDWREAPWRFTFNIYGWAPELPVDIKLGPISEDLPIDLGTLLDDLQFGAMMDFELRKGRIGAYFSPIVMFLKDTETVQGPLQKHKVTIKDQAFLTDFGVTYEIGRWHLGKNPNSPTVTVEPFVGARWLIDDFPIKIDPPDRKVKLGITFITPVIGLNTLWDLTERWHLRIEGDYGGFDVDNVEQTYNAMGIVGYRFKIRGVSSHVFAGYRYLHVHYKKEADIKVTVRGPLVGIGFEFSSN